MRFLPRKAGQRLQQLARTFPAVLVHGPRQCGKSTLVRKLYPGWLHVDLERPADSDMLRADLEGFFEANPKRVVVDEAQRMPEIFSVLRHVIDRGKAKGRFILLGSASPTLLRSVSETLAGRVGLLELTPFRAIELSSRRRAADPWFWGGFPPVHALSSITARSDWLDSYVLTFLERDLPSLGLGLAPHRLRTLWTMLTHVHGRLLNASDLARSLAVSSPTVTHYLDILEGAFMIRRLHPHHANIQKRLTKSPKIYIRDTGLLHFLAGLRRPVELKSWPYRGASFEGMVIEELAALAAEQVVRPSISFWRTQAGAEADLLIGDGRRLHPIEIKLGASVDGYSVRGLRECMKDLGIKKGWVISTGTERRQIGPGIEVVPWREVQQGRFDFGTRPTRRSG